MSETTQAPPTGEAAPTATDVPEPSITDLPEPGVESNAPAGDSPADAAAPDAAAPETADDETADDDADDAPFEATEDVVFNDLGTLSFSDAVDATLVEFDEGGLVTGTVVKIDADEVLLDIGFKSEGVIPAKELSIRNDVNP